MKDIFINEVQTNLAVVEANDKVDNNTVDYDNKDCIF